MEEATIAATPYESDFVLCFKFINKSPFHTLKVKKYQFNVQISTYKYLVLTGQKKNCAPGHRCKSKFMPRNVNR